MENVVRVETRAPKVEMMRQNTQRPPVTIEFSDLSYSVGGKSILNSISGTFTSGHMTAVLGASGAGKTSLLNILAGHVFKDVQGRVLINGKTRDTKKFHKISCYVMQEILLQPFLNVREAMMVATKLKLGNDFTTEEKEAAMHKVMALIGLEKCYDTVVENLSGGQKKKLSIALELVSNPPIIFLDEPTTGLDYVAMKNCVEILKSLSLQGRTVVCSIHQPIDSVFQLFDHAYFISEGNCVYNGCVNGIVPFLRNAELECPTTYSPADYIIELVSLDKENTFKLKDKIDNGKTSFASGATPNEQIENILDELDLGKYSALNKFPTSFWQQFCILSIRMLTQTVRHKTVLGILFGYHVIGGIILAMMFHDIGNSASRGIIVLSKLFYMVALYFMFLHVMTPVLLFPFELRLLQREYFNRWYSLKAYFAALTITALPLLVVNALMFIGILYPLTNQPLEVERIFWVVIISLLQAMASRGFGYCIGSVFKPTSGACVCSAIAIPLALLGIHGLGDGDQIGPVRSFLMTMAFPRHAFIGISVAILKDRPLLDCEEIFCYLRDPLEILRRTGMEGKVPGVEVGYLVVFMLLHWWFTYVCLRFRVSADSSSFLRRLVKWDR